jgi:hypothetical protein
MAGLTSAGGVPLRSHAPHSHLCRLRHRSAWGFQQQQEVPGVQAKEQKDQRRQLQQPRQQRAPPPHPPAHKQPGLQQHGLLVQRQPPACHAARRWRRFVGIWQLGVLCGSGKCDTRKKRSGAGSEFWLAYQQSSKHVIQAECCSSGTAASISCTTQSSASPLTDTRYAPTVALSSAWRRCASMYAAFCWSRCCRRASSCASVRLQDGEEVGKWAGRAGEG